MGELLRVSATAEDILLQTLPPVEKAGKTSLLLREKVREVFLPHWSISKNLPAPSKRRYKTKSSRSGRDHVIF